MKSILVVAAFGAAGALGPVASGYSRAEAREIARIRSHFDSVLVELKSADVSRFDAPQLARRAALTETLRGYRARGVFPHNYDFTEPTPYFIDRKTGTLCAVAFLMESTGRRDVVDRVAAANNNVWVAQLAGDREVESWLSQNGLTLDEAARIQVPYMAPAPVANGALRNNLAGAAAGTAGLLSIMTNSRGQSRTWIAAGLVIGLASMGVSANSPRSDDDGLRTSRRFSAGAGAFSVATALITYTTRRADFASRKASRVTVTPVATPSSSAGLQLNLRF